MVVIKKVELTHPDLQRLIMELDQSLKLVDGEDNKFYAQFNSTIDLSYALVAYEDAVPVGCGALKKHSKDSLEIKRMYVQPDFRKKGIAALILLELEKWSSELGYKKCILETGKQQVEAFKLYKKSNYSIIDNYDPYKGVANSICFEKQL